MQGGWQPFYLYLCPNDGVTVLIPEHPFKMKIEYKCPVCETKLKQQSVGPLFFCQSTHCNVYVFIDKETEAIL